MKIEIDGQIIPVAGTESIIEVADKQGIVIPRFCYHKKLSVAANCRMCLVEVENCPKPLPACATRVADGMRVQTRSEKTRQAQKAVMSLLLINHPLDCPICDQGGECELQDLSLGFGEGNTAFRETKRAVSDKNLGPLIATHMTRCIHCTRCVRFGAEIAGYRELGVIGRGERLEISPYVEQFVCSDLSGNIIDLCPVGALTSKPYLFRARAWEMHQKPSIGPHDGWGSHLYAHIKSNTVMRVVPKPHESINQNWLSDRDRFSYTALRHPQRLLKPKIKKAGLWQTVSWEVALQYTAEKMQQLGSDLAGVISPSSTLEEGYLFQKIFRCLGSNDIDHRLKQSHVDSQSAMPLFPHLGLSIEALAKQKNILLIGCDIPKELPLSLVFLRQAQAQGAKLFSLNPIEFSMPFEKITALTLEKGEFILSLASFIQNLAKVRNITLPESFRRFQQNSVSELSQVVDFIDDFSQENTLCLLGALALHHPKVDQILAQAFLLEQLFGFKVGILAEGANAAGMWLSGCVPHRLPNGQAVEHPGYHTKALFEKKRKGYLFFNVEPSLDLAQRASVETALEQAEFVCAFSLFETPELQHQADVLLPISASFETPGTFVNCEGHFQSFQPVCTPQADIKPGWKILRVLGNLLGLKGFDYDTPESVCKEISKEQATVLGKLEFSQALLENSFRRPLRENPNLNDYLLVLPTHIHDIDPLVRRATPLREKSQPLPKLHVNQKAAQALITLDEQVHRLIVKCDPSLPEGVALLDRNAIFGPGFSNPYCFVQIEFIEAM